jgi:diguanylate cyclase (GGDEF)-like protein
LADHRIIAGWTLAYGAMIWLRHRLGVLFALQLPSESHWKRWLGYMEGTVLASGLLWGLYGAYLATVADADRLAAIVITLGGLVSGAVIAYGVLRRTYFALPALLPIGLVLMAAGTYERVTLGLLVLAWLYFATLVAERFRSYAVEALNMQFENEHLMRDVVEQRDRAEELAHQLKRLSSQDGLTGIANRRHFDEELGAAWQAALEERRSLALVLCDVDSFKLYNDTYGHQQGDACLRQLAGLLQSHAKAAGALAARFGGEEFVVLLPRGDQAAAIALAESVRAALAALAMPHSKSVAAPYVTASLGVCATVPAEDQSLASLIARADEALYEAKHTGRNRVAARNFAA